MSDKLREAFERDLPAWWSKRLDDGSYSDPFRQKQWEGFQAGHAHAMRESADIAADGEPVAYVQNNDLRQARDYFKRYMSGDQTVDTGNLLWALQAALAHIDKAQGEPEMTDKLQQVLDTPGCERLKDFAAVGPAQRAALELFVDRLRAADQQAEPVAWMYHGIRYDGTEHEQTTLVWRPEFMDAISAAKGLRATPLYTAPPKAAPMTEEEILVRFDDIVGARAHDSKVIAFARVIEARKARP